MDGGLSSPHLPGHLYIHVPFCVSSCSYCDFYSVTPESQDAIKWYVLAVHAEMEAWQRAGVPGVVDTVYLGGGTPTAIGGEAVRLVGLVRERFLVRDDAEVTVEANPDSLTRPLLESLADMGANRISLGVQSFVDHENAILGRVHTVEQATEAASLVRDTGLELSIDLMCGIPGQTAATWGESLEKAVATGASHFSVYPLALQEGTPLDVAVGTGLVPEPDDDLAAEFMVFAEEYLRMQGIERYETANYARPGHECRHNMAYWTGRTYAGLGPAAHGMLDAVTASHVFGETRQGMARARVKNVADLAAWQSGASPSIEWLDAGEALREDAMLGLRLVRGIDAVLAQRADIEDVLVGLEEKGLVEREGRRWRTTRRGWLLGNEVFSAVWAG
jgi:oxygen-independent coproporphyrinogen-3 oxidase